MPRQWTFAELRKLLDVPEAVDFRYGCRMIEVDGRLRREDYLEAIMPEGERDGKTGMAADHNRS